MNARIEPAHPGWNVTYDGIFRGWFRYWPDAVKSANCVTVLMRRGEPTA